MLNERTSARRKSSRALPGAASSVFVRAESTSARGPPWHVVRGRARTWRIRAARAINARFKREGKVFAFRYSAKQIKTASYARNALSYVLNNWRKHRADYEEGKGDTLFDIFSSARSFAGWTEEYQCRLVGAKPPPEYEAALPVSLPRTALLRSQWQWHGLIDPFEMPSLLG